MPMPTAVPFNHRHSSIPEGQEEHYLLDAFRQDFAVNGQPAQIIRVLLTGWQRYRDDPRERVKKAISPGSLAPAIDPRRSCLGDEEVVSDGSSAWRRRRVLAEGDLR